MSEARQVDRATSPVDGRTPLDPSTALRKGWGDPSLRRLAITVACMVATLLCRVGTAWGQGSPEIEERHRSGNELRAQHRDAEAVEVFRALWEETREPRALARLALAEAGAGRWVEAERDLQLALREADDPWINERRSGLEGELVQIQTHLGYLQVECSTTGAELWRDGALVTALPQTAPQRVIAGPVTFEVRAPGHDVATRSVQVGAGYPITRVEVALIPTPPVVTGPSTSEIEARHTHGLELREQHRDTEAIEVFRMLWQETREPRALARMATAEAAAGQWVEAEAHLQMALGQQDNDWINSRRTGLEAELSQIQTHLGSLIIESPTRGAEVWSAGIRLISLPMWTPLRLNAGALVIEVRAPGYETASRSVLVAPGSVPTRLDVTLSPIAEQRIALPSVVRTPVGSTREESRTDTGGTIRRSPLIGLGVASLIGSGVGVGVGIVGLVLRNRHAATFRDRGCELDTTLGEIRGSYSGCQAEYEAGTAMEQVTFGGALAGGILLVAGVVMLVAAPHPSRSPRTAFACSTGPGAFGVTCEGRF